MDFSTISSDKPSNALPLLRQAMTSITRFEPQDLLTASHAGSNLTMLSNRSAAAHHTNRHSSRLHSHVWHEICLPLEGPSAIETDDAIYALDPSVRPALIINAPGMAHCERRMSKDSSHAMQWFAFSKTYIISMISMHTPVNKWQIPLRWQVRGKVASQATAALPLVSNLQGQCDPSAFTHRFESFRMAMLALAANVYQQAMTPRSKPLDEHPLGQHHLELLQQLALFIEQHLDQPIRLEQLASIAHFSPNHLNTLFRRWTGLPVHAWLVKKRMDKAMQLLQQPGMLAKQVALEVGYDDPLYFSRAFHKHFGFWPSQAKESESSMSSENG